VEVAADAQSEKAMSFVRERLTARLLLPRSRDSYGFASRMESPAEVVSVTINRREWLAGASQLALASAMAPHIVRSLPMEVMSGDIRDEFPLPRDRAYLNNGSIHPMSRTTRAAVDDYFRARGSGGPDGTPDPPVPKDEAKASFAAIINAKATEIAFIPSTTVGEHLVVAGMGLPGSKGNVVTDGLHFDGSLYMYESMRNQGLDVRMAIPKNGRVELEQLDALIDRDTKLVAVSFVSYLNGFTHDMKQLCALAHSRGAYVYADIIQGAGSTPIDVRDWGIDFCACSTYKWLMGDLGVGFLYVREDLLDRVVHRPVFGFRQIDEFDYHFAPFGTPGAKTITYQASNSVAGHFEVGTWASAQICAAEKSMAFIRSLGVERIQAHNHVLTRRLQQELPRLGYASLTPVDSLSSIVSFAVKDEQATTAKLAAGKADVTIRHHTMRISPSIYNSDADVDQLLNALS